MSDRDGRGLRLDQLAELSGLTPLLIRAWERRYGFPVAERTAGGHRRYTAEQAELLRRAALLVRSGLRAADAVARVRGGEAAPPDVVGVSELAALLVGGDVVAALDRLRAAWVGLGFEPALEELVLPALREIGRGWSAGQLTVAQEHVATGVVLSWLGAVRAELPVSAAAGEPAYLLATPEGEEHAVAVWALELLLRLRGVRAVALGASVPAADLARAVAESRPFGVVLALEQERGRRWLAPYVRLLNGLTLVFVGGAGVGGRAPEGAIVLPPTLKAAARLLAERAR